MWNFAWWQSIPAETNLSSGVANDMEISLRFENRLAKESDFFFIF